MAHKHREVLSSRNTISSLCETSCGAHFKPDVTSLFVGWCIYENFRSLLPRPWRPFTSQLRHSLVIHPQLKKILDPPLHVKVY